MPTATAQEAVALSGSGHRPRSLAVLTNILAPYRIPLFERLARDFDLNVLLSGEEGNRSDWSHDHSRAAPIKVRTSWGITLPHRRLSQGVIVGTGYLHVNPGLLLDLIRLRPDAVISDEMGFRTLMALLYGWVFRKPVWVWWGGTLHTEQQIGRGKRLLRRLLVTR